MVLDPLTLDDEMLEKWNVQPQCRPHAYCHCSALSRFIYEPLSLGEGFRDVLLLADYTKGTYDKNIFDAFHILSPTDILTRWYVHFYILLIAE